MKPFHRMLTVLLTVALLAGAYLLGTTNNAPAALALNASDLTSKELAAALSTAAYVSCNSIGGNAASTAEIAAHFYNTFLESAK